MGRELVIWPASATHGGVRAGLNPAFDLTGGLGYAPPALDGIAVERASEPVAASPNARDMTQGLRR